MITEDRLTKALRYLAETDEPCATAKADMERAKFRAEAVRDARRRGLGGELGAFHASSQRGHPYRAAFSRPSFARTTTKEMVSVERDFLNRVDLVW